MRGTIITAIFFVGFVVVILAVMDDAVSRVSVIGGMSLSVCALLVYGSRRALEFVARRPQIVRCFGLGLLLAAIVSIGVIAYATAWRSAWGQPFTIVAALLALFGLFILRLPASVAKAIAVHDRLRPGEGQGTVDNF
jgi:hypothetical protein